VAKPADSNLGTVTAESAPAAEPPDRVSLARVRIGRVLERRRVAHFRELERQVCEVGYNFAKTPPRNRPEPVHFTTALRSLVAAGEIRLRNVDIDGQNARIYSRAADKEGAIDSALADKIAALRTFFRAERIPEVAGYHAESVHHHALTSCDDWFSVGWKAGAQITRLHDRELSAGDVDLAGVHTPSGVRVVAQVKNGREWIYPANDVIWHLFGAAVELDAVPVLIARRLPVATFTLMKVLGGHAHRAVKMLFPPEARDSTYGKGPTLFEALTHLGFHTDADFVAAESPPARHRALWQRHLPARIDEMSERFARWSDDIASLSFEEGLRDDRAIGTMSGESRHDLVQRFINHVLEAYRDEEDDEVDDIEVVPEDHGS
jgi:hypothetical protein